MNLFERRKLLGISQINLATELGVSVMTVQLWERGATTPSPENQQLLENTLRRLEDAQDTKIQARRDGRVNGAEK